MTILAHYTMVHVGARVLKQPVGVCIALGLIGALPDPLALPWTVQGNWELYLWLHEWHWWGILLPPYALHLGIDYLTHDSNPPYGWYWWAYIVEVLFWLAMIVWGVRVYLTNKITDEPKP